MGNVVPNPPAPREFGRLNALGCWSYFRRGLLRFWRVSWTSILGACVSSGLLLVVFMIAGREGSLAAGLSIAEFVAPGVILFASSMMAFEGGATLMLEDKIEGTIADVLMAPLSTGEMLVGMVLPPVFNAVATGLAVFGVTLIFTDFSFSAPLLSFAFLILNALFFALVGALVGLWADKWDHYGGAQAFLMLPLGFLSGAFFSLDALPQIGKVLVYLNPLFHSVDAARFGLTGYGQSSALIGAVVLISLSVLLTIVLWRLVHSGYKVRP